MDWREERREERRERRRARRSEYGPSLFFPILLITIGVIWLLINTGRVPVENLYYLLPLWPILLILGGINILLRRVSWMVSGLVWLVVAATAVYVLLAPPSFLSVIPVPELKHETFQAPLGEAQSADVKS